MRRRFDKAACGTTGGAIRRRIKGGGILHSYLSSVAPGDLEVTWRAGRKARRQNLCASQHSASQWPSRHHRGRANLTARVRLNPATPPHFSKQTCQESATDRCSTQTSTWEDLLLCYALIFSPSKQCFHSVREKPSSRSGHLENKHSVKTASSHFAFQFSAWTTGASLQSSTCAQTGAQRSLSTHCARRR